MISLEKEPATTVTDHKGNLFYPRGSKPQLMTPLFKMFVLFSQPIFALINSVVPVGWLISLALFTWWFIADRDLLKKENAFVPSGWWWLLVPVYIYKRQNRNGNSRLWFVWHLLSIFISIIISACYYAAIMADS